VATVKDFKKKCADLGFKGRFFCSEIGASRGWRYPPGPSEGYRSEMEYAKLQLRKLVLNNGLDLVAGPCHPHFTGFYHDQPFTRMTWPSQLGVPLSGAASYYAWRTVATVTDDFYAREFPITFSTKDKVMCFTFE